MMKHIVLPVLAAVALAGCQSYQENQSRRSKITQFVLNHPVAAQAIGVEHDRSSNISSNAARFALRTGLDDTANGDGRGTQVNAVRHALWQAAIASKFDSETAEKVGNAYQAEMDARDGKNDYYSRLAADNAVDLRNNRIGREIGSSKPESDMKTLANDVLHYYLHTGLWTASKAGKGWHVEQSRLSEREYSRALKNIEPLNADGMTEEEQRNHKPDTFREIKRAVRALNRIED
ncbi:DUF6973 domain-containing protein [Neisseria animalis]|uniref:DUF6973 domain-containing protein n=1 Tax=Neisseria animalis TaxID=492 RepID=A0A5P3MTZ0_NEIAN|nr:hypothetical protein [Neisseria animalis]QEY25087.1 hypothetical protein D0T90_10450 [Neisseria animalis]ROW31577.1 hypothetical protein CGZ60_09635 [Neisseria animalis]